MAIWRFVFYRYAKVNLRRPRLPAQQRANRDRTFFCIDGLPTYADGWLGS
jgi:hypothetical protein